MGERWNPWRALRGRPEVTFARAPLPDGFGGAVCARWTDGSAVIVVDVELGRRRRNAALAHELVHLERDGGADQPGMPDGWHVVVAREERRVNRIVASRLVPIAELAAFVERMTDLGEPVTATLVADEFDTTDAVAAVALQILKLKEVA